MDGIHPTMPGTELLLKEINQHTKIITDGRFITDKKMYRGVNSDIKYGCLSCPTYIDLTGTFLCSVCCLPPLSAGEGQAEGIPGPGGGADPVAAKPPATRANSPADVDMSKTFSKREGDDTSDANPSKKLIVPSENQNAELVHG